jgi:HK97 gp10 family phage protein
MDSEVNITGLSDLQAQLDQLAANIEKKLLRGALRAGQKVTLERARQGIHSVDGDLAKSLRISTSARGGAVKAIVKAGNAKAFYARWVEFGTAAHIIRAKNGQAISLNGHLYASLNHPGARARPFMRPALDAAAVDNSEAFLAVGAYLVKGITKELAKLPDETQ